MANFTKKAIVDSFYKLLVKKPFNQITVKDIVTDCGVNRNSFYYYFEDIPSLLADEISILSQNLMECYSNFDSIEEWLLHVLNIAKDNKKIIDNCIAHVDSSVSEKYLTKIFTHIISDHIEKSASVSNVSESDKAIMVRLLIYQYIGFFHEWIKNGMRDDAVDSLKRMCYLQENTISQMIHNASKQEYDN